MMELSVAADSQRNIVAQNYCKTHGFAMCMSSDYIIRNHFSFETAVCMKEYVQQNKIKIICNKLNITQIIIWEIICFLVENSCFKLNLDQVFYNTYSRGKCSLW